ncbi:MAG TPA: ABC transporter permease, partial [Rubrivivax sp.]|nr:ABC transporter permease [Rubrivivax sp.]
MPRFVLLWTDAVMWAMAAALVAYVLHAQRSPARRADWRKVFRDPAALASSVLLVLCLAVTLADSVHYRPRLAPAAGVAGAAPAYDVRTISLLDGALARLVDAREQTYSRPLAYVGFTKESVEVGGKVERVAPRLQYGGAHLSDPEEQWIGDLLRRGAAGLGAGLAAAALLLAAAIAVGARRRRIGFAPALGAVLRGEGDMPWRVAGATVLVLGALIGAGSALAARYHLFGTDLTGNDVLYQAIKSIRTAFVIGSLATIATLPLAVVLGIMAGY